MTDVTLFIAPLGARNIKEKLFEKITGLCPGNDYSSVLYLGPDSPYLVNTRKLFHFYLSGSGKNRAYIPFQANTIRQLAFSLYETYGSLEIISDEIRTLILLRLLEEQNLGYARLLSGLLNKIRHHILDKDLKEVKAEIDRLIFEDKARDRALSALDTLQAYEDLLVENKYIDSEKILRASISLMEQHFSTAVLVIDGFFDPTPLEMEIISALVDRAENVLVLAEEKTILAGFLQNKRPITINKLKPCVIRDSIGFFTYSSIEDEVEGIAKSVRRLLLDGMNTWEIALSFPLLSRYLPMIKRIFKSHGIPLSIGEYKLSYTKPLIAINEIITCIEEDYVRSDFLSVLTSPLLPAISDLIKEQAVSYAYQAGIIKGKESWLSIEKTLVNEGAGIFDDYRQNISGFQKGIKKIIELLEDIRHRKDIIAYLDSFENALDKLGFFDALESDVAGPAGDIANKVTRQFSELRRYALMSGPEESAVHTGLCLSYLLEQLSATDTNQDGVRVLSYDQAASIETKALFFGGMVEGEFPSRPAIDPILPEKVKQELGVPSLEYYLKRQKQYFHRLLNISENPPVFSCPTAEGDKIFLPSPFLDWDQAMRPVEWNIFSEEEVLVREGKIKGPSNTSKILWDSDPGLNRKSIGLINHRLSGYLNVTDIDFYRKCPMRFYIEKVLKLEIDGPPRFEVEARLWGSLAHRVMERLFKDGDLDINDIDNRLYRCLEEGLSEFPVGDFWARVAREIFQKLLPKLKEQEQDIRMQGYSPVMVEKKLTAEFGGLKLKGKVDRIDKKRRQGVGGRSQEKEIQNSKLNSVILLDYKTGNIDSNSLQMPLYALMWRESFPETVDKVGYYSLKEGRVTWYPKRLSMDEYTEEALTTAEELVSNMRNGRFPPEPLKASECRYCSHSPMCER